MLGKIQSKYLIQIHKKCPQDIINIVRLLGLGVGVILLLIYMVRYTLRGATVKRSVSSTYQKILLNHIQIVVITSTFNYSWPEMVQKFFAT